MSNNKELVIYGIIGTASAGAGFGVGFYLAKRKWQRIAAEDIASVKETYGRLRANAQKPEPENLIERIGDVIASEGYSGAEPAEAESKEEFLDDDKPDYQNAYADAAAEKVQQEFEAAEKAIEEKVEDAVHSVFNDHSDSAARQPSDDKPYLITADEWHESEWDNHTKIPLKYYKGDDTLTDEQDRVVDDVEAMVGEANLTRFGQGDGDPQLIYVRNKRIGCDFEVLLDEGHYLPNNEE